MTATAHGVIPGAEPAMAAVICDEHLLFAEAFAEALRARGMLVVVTADAALTVQLTVRHAAAIVVVNPEPWTHRAAAVLREIRRARPQARLVCLSDDTSGAAGVALDDHVDLVVSKRLPLRNLVDLVITGPTMAAKSLLESGSRKRRHREPAPLAAQFLNPREQQVLRLLARAESTREIARHLGISVPTARGYIQSIFSKLGVHSRVEALNYAVQHALVEF